MSEKKPMLIRKSFRTIGIRILIGVLVFQLAGLNTLTVAASEPTAPTAEQHDTVEDEKITPFAVVLFIVGTIGIVIGVLTSIGDLLKPDKSKTKKTKEEPKEK